MSASRSEAAASRPVTPAISQLLRSFAYTPEPKAWALTPGSVQPRSQHTQSPWTAVTVGPSTVPARRQRTKSLDDGILPVIQKKARKGYRKDTSPTGAQISVTVGSAQDPGTRGRSKKSRAAAGADHVVDTVSRPVRKPKHSRRTVLDAVEIVRKTGTSGYQANLGNSGGEEEIDLKTELEITGRISRAAHSLPGCHNKDCSDLAYPTSTSSSPDPATGSSPGIEPVLPLRTSKYFTQPSTAQTPRFTPVNDPDPSPSFPALTTPAYKSSGLGCFPLEFSRDGSDVGDELERPRSPSYSGLFDDLMIMLRRLKPILIQEIVRDDPWKVLIAVRLLNVTTGKAAIPVFCKIIFRWPTPQDLMNAPTDELIELLRPLGLYNKRAKWLRDISKCYIENPPRYLTSGGSLSTASSSETLGQSPPSQNEAIGKKRRRRQSNSSTKAWATRQTYPTTPISHFPGVGPYALDSFRIFCKSVSGEDAMKDEWKRVMPSDKELVGYLRWKWAAEEGKIWYPKGMGVIGDVDLPYLVTLVDELAGHYDSMIGGEGYMYHFSNDLCDALTG